MDKNVKLVLGVAVVGGVIALAYKYFNNDEKKSNARGIGEAIPLKSEADCGCDAVGGGVRTAVIKPCPCLAGEKELWRDEH